MKKSILMLSSFLLSGAIIGCSVEGGAAHDARSAALGSAIDFSQPHSSQRTEPPQTSEFSIYEIESAWWDQDGTTRNLESLSGRVQLLSMVYTSCGHSCPRILGDMKKIEDALGPENVDRVGFVLASLDSDRDTPERLRQYAHDLRLEPDRWTLLGADAATVLDLAAVLGIRYRRESSTEFSHTNQIFVLTPRGEIAYRMNVGESSEKAIAVVRALTD